MSMMILEPGDTAYYPNYNVPIGKPMTVLDRQIVLKWGTNKISYVRYLYGPEFLENFCETLHENIRNDYDNVIVIEGREGSGKSQLAYQICKTFDPDFDMKVGYIYDYDEFLDGIKNVDENDRGKIFWMDEATNIASNRDFAQTDNKRFIQLLEMMRSRGWTLVMCIPSVERLDVYLREHRIRYLITCWEMSWDKVYTTKSRGFYELSFKHGDSYQTFKTIGYGTFGVMTPEERKVYDAIKRQSQNRKIKQIEEMTKPKGGKTRERMQNRNEDLMAMLVKAGVSKEEIAKQTGLDIQSVKVMVSNGNGRAKKKAEAEASEKAGDEDDVE